MFFLKFFEHNLDSAFFLFIFLILDNVYVQLPIGKKNKESYQEELEERLISLIASLFGKKASVLLIQFHNTISFFFYSW